MTDEEYREPARKHYAKDGEIEIDDGATVSHALEPAPQAPCHSADDEGAYVQAWVWVANEEATTPQQAAGPKFGKEAAE